MIEVAVETEPNIEEEYKPKEEQVPWNVAELIKIDTIPSQNNENSQKSQIIKFKLLSYTFE